MPGFLLSERPTVSVVVPMYNEEENIGHALPFLSDALGRYAADYEIIVVDDASTDGSAQIVEAAVVHNPRIRLLRHATNQKLGRTLRTGFAAATKELVFYTDADIAVDPEDLGRAIRAMRLTRADVVAAYRFDRVPEGYRRAIYSIVYNTLIALLFGWPLRDINFACKLFRRDVLEALDFRSTGSLIDAELIIKARNAGFTVQQIGVDYFPRGYGRSSLASSAVVLRILRELMTLYPEMRRPVRKGSAATVDSDRPGAPALS